MDPDVAAALGRGHVVVFMDVAHGAQALGRIYLELFKTVAPRTVENFRRLFTGEYRTGKDIPLGYKGCVFHRVIADFMIQGGDFVNGDGTGSFSIYGTTFADETFEISHSEPGLISCANSGPNTNGCQFFILCKPAPWLDGKHCVFGRVLNKASMDVVRKIERVNCDPRSNRPKVDVAITECGEM